MNRRSRFAFTFVMLSAFSICSSQLLYAQTNTQLQTCQAKCPSLCNGPNLLARQVATCVNTCKQNCETPNPLPITITPKYMIVSLVYAPPGCSAGTPTACGTTNGSSFVDYNSSSANGTKVTTKDSFQLGLTISYDNSSLVGGIGGGGSYGFSETTSDSSAVNVTKSQTSDLKVIGNGDGIDHGQDMFLLLLKPSVTLKKNGNQVLWSISSGGSLYEVYVSELQRPSTMRPSSVTVFNELGFTNDDYQAILSEDPFGGTVNTGSATSVLGSITGNSSGTFTTGADTSSGLDPHRFWLTSSTFPYQPTKPGSTCNNGVCNCAALSTSFTNDKLSDNTSEDDGQTTVDLYGSVGVPKVWSLKADTKMVWTTSATTDNSTESKQTATVAITCPSTNYTGDTGMYVYWDSRYGAFVFVPFDPGSAAIIHQGQVMDSSGHSVGGQLVQMIYGGKTYHTFTAPDGTYRFPSSTGKRPLIGTAEIITGSLKQIVNVGMIDPVIIRMK